MGKHPSLIACRRDPTPERGEAMRALPAKWQAAVDALFLTAGDQTKAIEIAGYRGKRESLRVMAHRIFADDRVRRAVREECNKRIDLCEPELLAQTMGILRDHGEKAADRLRAIGVIWDRANPVRTEHTVTVHRTDDSEMFELVKRMAAELGMAPEMLLGAGTMPAIDVTPQEVSIERSGAAGLEPYAEPGIPEGSN